MGLETTVGPADRRIVGLPALRGVVAPAGAGAASAAVRPDDYRATVVDEVVEIRLGFDRQTGRLAIAGGDVRREPRTLPMSPAGAEQTPREEYDAAATVGSRIDLVA